jgi:poly(3-hydroxybutyrate) depolymerase
MVNDNTKHDGFTRREFAKVAGLSNLAAAAMGPATAGFVDSGFASADELTGEDTIAEPFTPSNWDTVGPFQYQRRDTFADWLTPVGGEQAVSDGATGPEGELLPSAFAAGGSAEWQEQQLDGGSTVPLDFSSAIVPEEGQFMPLTGDGLLNNVQGWYGYGGSLLARAYALSTFERENAAIAVLETNASQIWVNGRAYSGTPVAVPLQEGTNVVLVKNTITLGAGSVDVEFRPPAAAVEATAVTRVPQLREGEQTDRPAAVRVTNTTSESVSDVTVTLAPEEAGLIEEQTVEVDPPLAPFETRLVNTRVVTTQPVSTDNDAVERVRVDAETVPEAGLGSTTEAGALAGAERDGLDEIELRSVGAENQTAVVATVEANGQTDDVSRGLAVRGPGDQFVTTYVSVHDRSVQRVGIKLPANYDTASGPFEAVHYLHGAGVDANSAAGSVVARDDVIVVAPLTRGAIAYDHEDLGRVDDMEALRVAKERFNIDEDQVYCMGHSMGGHGSLHLGLTHTDQYAAIGPQSCWPDHESYVSVPFKRDRLHSHPRLWQTRETSLHKNKATVNTENVADGATPMFFTHGGTDTTTPPAGPRTMIRTLANRGLDVATTASDRYNGPGPDEVDIVYLEAPGAGHFWDKGIDEGTDAVNHPDQWEFIRQAERDEFPPEITFHTTNLAIEDTKYWVRVLEQQTAQKPTRVRASIQDNGALLIQTENVATLELDTGALTAQRARGGAVVNDQRVDLSRAMRYSGTVRMDIQSDGVTVELTADQYSSSSSSGLQKDANTYGPIRQVQYDPYRIVYGTGGDETLQATALGLANLRSHRLVGRARAPAPVVPDEAVDSDMIQRYNLVLVGTPANNSVLAGINGETPITVGDGQVDVGSESYYGDLGVQYCYPHPDATDNLMAVVSGTSAAGLRLNELVNMQPTQTPSPDMMVFDDSFRYQGYNGCLAAGYFDVDWSLESKLVELRDTN